MKTKSSIWLSICTFVLCLGVMATGVYAALSVNLSMSGMLGFNMHNAMVTMSGTIQNVTEQNATTNRNVERTYMGTQLPLTISVDFDDLYFSSGNDMIFEITFKNITDTSMQATIPIPTADGTVVTVLTGTANGYTNFTDENNTYKASIPVGSSKTVTFALRLANPDALATELTSFSWKGITFEEYVAPDVLQWSNDIGWHIEMGSYNATAVKWVPIAQSTDGTTFTQFDGKTYTTSNEECKPQSGYTYYFLSYNILPVQYYTNETATSGSYMLWNFYDNTSSNATYRKAWYWDEATNTTLPYTDANGAYVNPNDYSVSNIRNYLNGNTSFSSYTTPNYTPDTTKKLTTINELYSLDDSLVYTTYIQPRSISDLYAGGITASSTSNTATYTNTTPPTTSKGTGNDKLWLLSHQEFYSYVSTNTATHNVDATNTSHQTLKSGIPLGRTSVEYWWLRSSYSSYSYYTFYVSGDGAVDYNLVYNTGRGVRPAFQIQIP